MRSINRAIYDESSRNCVATDPRGANNRASRSSLTDNTAAFSTRSAADRGYNGCFREIYNLRGGGASLTTGSFEMISRRWSSNDKARVPWTRSVQCNFLSLQENKITRVLMYHNSYIFTQALTNSFLFASKSPSFTKFGRKKLIWFNMTAITIFIDYFGKKYDMIRIERCS